VAKTDRLFELMQLLRERRRPVTAQVLADNLGVSLRTVYRDIDALLALGAGIDGSAGIGYQLRTGFFLPPLMFTDDEMEALVLGARWVQSQPDASLQRAADSALAKIAAAGPEDLRERIDEIGLWAPWPKRSDAPPTVDLGVIRRAVRDELQVALRYRDVDGHTSERTVWPIVLGYFDDTRIVAAWCTLRQGYRHFRVDRIVELQALAERYPRARRQLVKAWRAEIDARRVANGHVPTDTPARGRYRAIAGQGGAPGGPDGPPRS